MISALYRKVESLYEKKIDGRGLAIFRICYSLVLLGEILQLFYFRQLIFDKIPYLVPGEIQMWPALLIWMGSVIFIIFGLFTRLSAIINYLLSIVVIGTISSYEYHMFYTYLTINFLFIFLPISKTISLDRLLLKLKYSNTRFNYNPPTTVSVLSYYVPLLFGIGFVYFDSIFYKTVSPLWMHGLGVWLPASMPQAVFINVSSLLNVKILVVALGYLTLVFEAIFLFTYFRKRWRMPMLLIGVGLHLGILICFPIPFFALGVMSLYLLMVPVKYWNKLLQRKDRSKKKIKFFYDGECPLCNRTKIVLNHFDSRNNIEFLTVQGSASNEPALKNMELDVLLNDIYSLENGKLYNGYDTYIRVFNSIWYLLPLSWIMRIPGIYSIGKKVYRKVASNRVTERCTEDNCGYVIPELPVHSSKMKLLENFTLRDLKVRIITWGIGGLIILQILVSYNSPLPRNLRKKLHISDLAITRFSETITKATGNFSKIFFGITHHGVFMESHFRGYNHSIAIVYKSPSRTEEWLPIVNRDGTPGNYIKGPLWCKWTFRVSSPMIDQQLLSNGIRDFTAFWAKKHGISLKNAVFQIKVKKNLVPTEWKQDFLGKQLQNPWIDGGLVKWKDDEFYPEIKEIEQL